MTIAFVVDQIDREVPTATTLLLARSAAARGHTVYVLDVLALMCFADGAVGGEARVAPTHPTASAERFLRAMQGPDAPRRRISTADLDVLWLRQNPSEWHTELRRTVHAGILFGQLAARRGVLVLDDPDTLVHAESKLYLQHFPEFLRPRTLITRSTDEARRFYDEAGGRIVLKPLDGYGGEDVFVVDRDTTNLNTIVESIGRRGFVVAQEYLPAAAHGDVRLFMMNGEPLVSAGRYAAIRRYNPGDDPRSNLTAGAVALSVEIDADVLSLAARVGAKLKADGIFFAGLDIVGGRVVEISTVSAGGLNIATRLEAVDFGDEIVRAIERKLEHKRRQGATLSNRELASMD